MKNLLIKHRYSVSLILFLVFIQSFFVELNNPYKNPIAGDAQGYYAYLPAIFIYGDLQFEFVKPLQEKYYAPSLQKSFLNEVAGKQVNKTFPGVSLLYLPGFVVAHTLALIGVAEPDGYSWIYQICFLVNFWFFVYLGFIYSIKSLTLLGYNSKIATLSTGIVFLSTNVFFYTVFDQSVTHLFTFFLVSFSLYHLLLNRHVFNEKSALLFFLSFAFILIIRPTNLLVLVVYLFFIPELKFYSSFLSHVFKPKVIWKILLPCLAILAIPPILWKIQTGHWIVYSYGEEGFNFSQPEFYNFLFSYTKGWFVYTPILLILCIVSIILFYKKDTLRLFIFLFGILLIVYVYSSWWCWYYGAGMSQRVMIDFYVLFIFILASFLQKIQSIQKSVKLLFAFIISAFISVNVVQAFQVAKGILPFGSPTKQQYWDNFLSLHKKAIIYPPEHWQLIASDKVNLQNRGGQLIKGNSVLFENANCLTVDSGNQYSATACLPQLNLKTGDKIIFSFEAKSIGKVKETRVVFTIDSSKTNVFYLEPYCNEDWQKMDYLIEIDANTLSAPTIFMWNAGSSEQVWIKNIRWKIYFSDEYF